MKKNSKLKTFNGIEATTPDETLESILEMVRKYDPIEQTKIVLKLSEQIILDNMTRMKAAREENEKHTKNFEFFIAGCSNIEKVVAENEKRLRG